MHLGFSTAKGTCFSVSPPAPHRRWWAVDLAHYQGGRLPYPTGIRQLRTGGSRSPCPMSHLRMAWATPLLAEADLACDAGTARRTEHFGPTSTRLRWE
jgi:hypothetical protein